MNRNLAAIVGPILFVGFLAGNYLARGGDINPPPGPVAPTMRTLDEVYNAILDSNSTEPGWKTHHIHVDAYTEPSIPDAFRRVGLLSYRHIRMADSIASFALRGATHEQLAHALGRCFAEFMAWHGQAMFVAQFADDARMSGVESILADRNHQALDFAACEGLISNSTASGNQGIARVLADRQMAIADQGVKISAIVMLHNACERFLWRLVRFGLVGNRKQVLEWIGKRNLTVETLLVEGVEASIDSQIEKWWDDLERDGLAIKWERLVGIAGYPAKLSTPTWHFDKEMLVSFDKVRHNAVHHDARAAKAFDLPSFANQLWRAQLLWVVQVAQLLQLRIPAETLLTGT